MRSAIDSLHANLLHSLFSLRSRISASVLSICPSAEETKEEAESLGGKLKEKTKEAAGTVKEKAKDVKRAVTD